MTSGAGNDGRLLFLAATAKDGATTQALLAPLGIRVDVCRTFTEMLEELPNGAGAVLLPEESATSPHNTALKRLLDEQPPWSDLPVLILARTGADSAESRGGDAPAGKCNRARTAASCRDPGERRGHRAARAPASI